MNEPALCYCSLYLPIVPSHSVRSTSFRFFHVKNNVAFVVHATRVGWTGDIRTAGNCDRWEDCRLALLHLHPVSGLPSLQHARLFCHLDHQRLNPRCPPITTRRTQHALPYVPIWTMKAADLVLVRFFKNVFTFSPPPVAPASIARWCGRSVDRSHDFTSLHTKTQRAPSFLQPQRERPNTTLRRTINLRCQNNPEFRCSPRDRVESA